MRCYQHFTANWRKQNKVNIEAEMSLISCPECNNTTSSKAKSCPHCGFPIQANFFRKNLSNTISKAAKSARDKTRISCSLCGHEVGIANLSGGVCSKCRSVQRPAVQMVVYSRKEIASRIVGTVVIIAFTAIIYLLISGKL